MKMLNLRPVFRSPKLFSLLQQSRGKHACMRRSWSDSWRFRHLLQQYNPMRRQISEFNPLTYLKRKTNISRICLESNKYGIVESGVPQPGEYSKNNLQNTCIYTIVLKRWSNISFRNPNPLLAANELIVVLCH